MIVRCIWHKPVPIFLRDKPPFEDKRVLDGMCDERMRELFEKAGMKADEQENDRSDQVS